MIAVIQTYLWPMAGALVIGIATGWWMFRHRRRGSGKPGN
jgi:hypothetical protein